MPAKPTQNILGQIAPVYSSEALAGLNELYHLAVRDQLLNGDPDGESLELGCGKGLYTEVLIHRYRHVDVVDGSHELLDSITSRLGKPANLSTHPILVEEFLEQTQKRWVHIYLTFLLEHLEQPSDVLRLIKRRMASDGRLFIAVPNSRSLHRVIAKRSGLIESTEELSENDLLVGHKRVYYPDLLRQQIEDAGLQILQENFVGFKPFTLGQMAALPDSVHRSLALSGDLCPKHAAYICMEVADDQRPTESE